MDPDPDPEGPKKCGSGGSGFGSGGSGFGSGSATLLPMKGIDDSSIIKLSIFRIFYTRILLTSKEGL